MMTSNINQRVEERINVALPIRLDGVSGWSRDISAGGICFDVDATFQATREIGFVIEIEASDSGILVKCKGSIMRTQVLGKTMSVAVKLTETIMETATS